MNQVKSFLILTTLFISLTSCCPERVVHQPVIMNKVPRPSKMPDYQDVDNTLHPGHVENLRTMYHNHSKSVRHIELLNGVIDSYEFRIDSVKEKKDED